MDTFYNLVNKSKEKLTNDFVDFFKTYTQISYNPLNRPGDSIYVLGSDYKWNELSEEGKRKQTELYKKYKKFYALIKALIIDLPSREAKELDKLFKYIEDYLLQNTRPYYKSNIEVLDRVVVYLNNQFKILDLIDFKDIDKVIMVPDTNALLINPDIEKWSFDSINSFQLLLLPTVLSELDKFKIAHHNKDLKDKANKIIKKIKEYRRRGKLTEGVKITKEISLSALALEPDFEKTLDWLDSKNNDDRIIASFIEVCRINIRNKVCLVTSDVNLQNKLEFADLLYIEPPENE